MCGRRADGNVFLVGQNQALGPGSPGARPEPCLLRRAASALQRGSPRRGARSVRRRAGGPRRAGGAGGSAAAIAAASGQEEGGEKEERVEEPSCGQALRLTRQRRRLFPLRGCLTEPSKVWRGEAGAG